MIGQMRETILVCAIMTNLAWPLGAADCPGTPVVDKRIDAIVCEESTFDRALDARLAAKEQPEALFIREMANHSFYNIARTGVKANRRMNARSWECNVRVTSPLAAQRIALVDSPKIEVRTTCERIGGLPYGNLVTVGCLYCRSLETSASWSHPFFGGFCKSPQGNTLSSTFSTSVWALPCGRYELTAMVFIQESPASELIFASSHSLEFAVDPSIESAAFQQGLESLLNDSKLGEHEKATLLKSHLSRGSLTPNEWNRIRAWKSAKELDLSELVIPEAVIESLIDFENLKVLNLSRSVLPQSSLKALGRLTKLKSLDLSDASFPPGALNQLAESKSIEVLKLSHLKLTRADFAAFARISALVQLDVSRCDLVSGIQAEALRSLERLTELNVRGSNIRNGNLVEIGGMRGLKRLNLAFTDIQPGALVGVLAHASIETIDLAGTNVGADDVGTLATLPNLKKVRLDLKLRDVDRILQLQRRGVEIAYSGQVNDVLNEIWSSYNQE